MAAPKFIEIKQHLTELIEQGKLAEHAKVPSENALAAQFECSRMTARRALTELVEQGVLVRSQGQGTFVASLKSQGSMLTIRNIADEVKERGRDHRVQVLAKTRLAADTEVAIALGLTPGTEVGHTALLHLEEGLPMQLEHRYVNLALVPGYLDQDFALQTPHEYLSQVAPLTEAHHEVEAVVVDRATAELLQLGPSEPCLRILRRTWSRSGAVSFARLTHPGSRYRLGGHLVMDN
ncbi:histidine utilization repressor [Ferrimonas futtsuensis]|uniref:histidine utilization repressor n=1 Tax=Ferrimonas futtsuensis TaxID=364764 RepID=UPI0003FCA056|nr:histidine utilization repressor [Ferrimonas futtsuensis]